MENLLQDLPGSRGSNQEGANLSVLDVGLLRESLGVQGGPEPYPPEIQGALVVVDEDGGFETPRGSCPTTPLQQIQRATFFEVRSYSPDTRRVGAGPGRLTPNSPRIRNPLNGSRGRLLFGGEETFETENGEEICANDGGGQLAICESGPVERVEKEIVGDPHSREYLAIECGVENFGNQSGPQDLFSSVENVREYCRSLFQPRVQEIGHSENMEVGGQNIEDPRTSPTTSLKHPREVHSSDSENSPKRLHMGATCGFLQSAIPEIGGEGVEEEGIWQQNPNLSEFGGNSQEMDQDGFDGNRNWEDWADGVDIEIAKAQRSFLEVNEAVGYNKELVENFMGDVQHRVEDALRHYEKAICEQFSLADKQNLQMRETLIQNLNEVAHEIEDRARGRILDLFSAHAVESGSLWRELAKYQAESLEELVKNRLSIEREALTEAVKCKILQGCKLEILKEVDLQWLNYKNDLERKISEKFAELEQKVEKVNQKHLALQNEVGQISKNFLDFCDETRRRRGAVEAGLQECLQKCREPVQGVPVEAKSVDMRPILQVLGEFREELEAKRVRDNLMFKKKMDVLEKKMEDAQIQEFAREKKMEEKVAEAKAAMVPPHPREKKPPKKVVDGSLEVLVLQPIVGEGSSEMGVGMVSIQNALLGCVEGGGVENEFDLPLGTNEVQVAPVAANANTDLVGILNLPIAAHLSRSQSAPKFSGKKEDWQNFLRKFDSWVRAISSGRTVLDGELLQLLNSCLPEFLQKELQLLEREKGKMPNYVEFRGRLEAMYGRAQSESMRKKWHDVQMPRGIGKVTPQHFQEFRVNFKLAMADVPDATPEEARRLLREKMPPFMEKWVIELEAKRMKNHPIIELVTKEGIAAVAIQASVGNWVGTPPKKVETKGGGVYHVYFEDDVVAHKLLELHGRSLMGHGKTIQARTVEQHLGVEEIFREVTYQMETQETMADLQRGRGRNSDYQVRELETQEGRVGKKEKKTNPPVDVDDSFVTPVESVAQKAPKKVEPQVGGNGNTQRKSFAEAVVSPPPVPQDFKQNWQQGGGGGNWNNQGGRGGNNGRGNGGNGGRGRGGGRGKGKGQNFGRGRGGVNFQGQGNYQNNGNYQGQGNYQNRGNYQGQGNRNNGNFQGPGNYPNQGFQQNQGNFLRQGNPGGAVAQMQGGGGGGISPPPINQSVAQ